MPRKDPEARKAYHREYMKRWWANASPELRKKVIDRGTANQARYNRERKKLVANFKVNGCSKCDEKEACCLSAHHLDGSKKDFVIANANGKQVGIKKLELELNKCVCLCHNCHAKVHAGLLKLRPKARRRVP